MTLNVTIISPNGIYQSSDLRLSDIKIGAGQKFTPLDEHSPKLITLQYSLWNGYLTYCGIGKWQHKATFETATEWIVALGPSPTFDDVAHAIEMQGSTWINSIQASCREFKPHTFILAAFEQQTPRISIISNTHSTKGSIARLHNAGLRASFGTDTGTHVYVTGIDNSVLKEDRIALKRLIRTGADPKVVRYKLANLNEAASLRIEARNGIGKSCMCYSLNSLGEGAGEIHGHPTGRLVPAQIFRGQDLAASALSKFLGPHAQLRGSAFSNSAASDAAGAEHIICSLAMAASDRPAVLIGHDLGQMNDMHVEISSTNEYGAIVGQLRRPVRESPHAFLWINGQQITKLPVLAGSGSTAKDVNNLNVVVGSCANSAGEWRAVLWRLGEFPLELGAMDANNSTAIAISDRDIVVGEVYRSPATPQTDYHRAFWWTHSRGMMFVPGVEHLWSRASDVNNRGDILGWCREPAQMCSFVWSELNGLCLIKGVAGRPFYASRINDAGMVIGEADDEAGVRRAMIWSYERGLELLNVPFAFSPTGIDNDGNIVGIDPTGPWKRAYLVTAQGEVIAIPGGADHNIDVCAIAGGAIFGHARKGGWKHVHPIRWDMALEAPSK